MEAIFTINILVIKEKISWKTVYVTGIENAYTDVYIPSQYTEGVHQPVCQAKDVYEIIGNDYVARTETHSIIK